MKVEGVIFDLDGTLLDTTEGVLESVNFVRDKLKLNKLPYDTMLKFVGPPIQQSFMRYYGISADEAQVAADYFRDYYKDVALLKAAPYEGIYELCDCLKSDNIKMAVATYKREDYAIELLRYFDFDKYCAVMHGADNFNKLSKSDIVNLCISELGVKREGCVLIGDTEHDAIGAQQAGISFVGVTYGFGFKSVRDIDVFASAGYAECPSKIKDILLGD